MTRPLSGPFKRASLPRSFRVLELSHGPGNAKGTVVTDCVLVVHVAALVGDRTQPGSTDQPRPLSRESAVAANGLVGSRSTGVGAWLTKLSCSAWLSAHG
jgi:hypothetical protein